MMGDLARPFADPTIASRATAVLSVTALAGVSLLAARATLPRQSGRITDVLLPAARDGYAYLAIGLATRFTIQQHKSRLQMLALLAVVAGVEVARLRPGTEPRRGATWLAGSVAVCLGVVMAKWALEPGALTAALDRLGLGGTE